MCTLSVSNVIYHKFSHGAAFYTLNGKNVHVMLEFSFASVFYSCFVPGFLFDIRKKIVASNLRLFLTFKS